MKVSGFTIVRNAVKFNYPVIASIRSILPICDEFIVNVGDSEDSTLELIRSIDSPKVRIIQSQWDMSQGSQVLSQETNRALKECKGDWAFYLQSDEVIHEADLGKLKFWMHYYLDKKDVDVLRFWWFHFYGSFWRYRIDFGWYQKQDRIVRNNKQIESFGDAYCFKRIDGMPLRTRLTYAYVYHYGWVNSNIAMQNRCDNALAIGYMDKSKNNSFTGGYGYLNRFPAYLGTHPAVMKEKVSQHLLSREDFDLIRAAIMVESCLLVAITFKDLAEGQRKNGMMDFKKILIINPYGIGDVLFTTPVISNLRLAYPQASMAYLANARTADFLKFNPDLAQVFVYERDEFVGRYHKYFELFNSIKNQGFDVVFDFSLNSSFGFLTAACGIKRRVGFDYRKRGGFLTDKVPLRGFEEKHIIEYYLDLLRLVQIPVKVKEMKMEVPSHDIQWAKEWLKGRNIDPGKPLIAVLPGGGASWGKAASFKRWPASNYAYLIDKIIENFDAAIILLGDPKEEELCRDVVKQANFPIHYGVGETTLLGLAALLCQAQGAIVNDGGPLHVAEAVGTKTVSIFGPVDPVVYGPYPALKHWVVQKGLPCQPCYRRFRMANCSHISCLGELSVEEVYRKVKNIL